MSQISVGEDILGIVLAVSILSAFTVVLEESYSNYQRHEREEEKFKKILELSDLIRYNTTTNQENNLNPGIIQRIHLSKIENRLPNFYRKKLRVKIVSMNDGSVLRTIGENMAGTDQTISFPITYEDQNIRKPARMIIQTD